MSKMACLWLEIGEGYVIKRAEMNNLKSNLMCIKVKKQVQFKSSTN